MLSYALRVIKGAHSDSRNENNFHNWEICLSSVFSFRDVDLLTWPHLYSLAYRNNFHIFIGVEANNDDTL